MLRKIWKKIRKGVCIANSFICGFGIGWFGTGAIILLSPVEALAAVGCVALWYLNYQWALKLDYESYKEQVAVARRKRFGHTIIDIQPVSA